jgi:FAD/FMN-containing dehydrogenase
VQVTDAETLQRDFGGFISRRPKAVHTIASVDDALSVVHRSIASGAVKIRGAGHSSFGQTLKRGGTTIEVRGTQVPIRVGVNRVVVFAGSTWREIDDTLRRWRLSVPVTPDYLDLTVGGTLSMGGYGVHSVRRGSQLNWVDEFTLLTLDGQIHRCSLDADRELFGYALAGQGKLGIIADVTLRVLPLRRYTTVFQHRAVTNSTLRALLYSLNEPGTPIPDTFEALVGDQLSSVTIGFEHLTAAAASRMKYPKSLPTGGLIAKSVSSTLRSTIDHRLRQWLSMFTRHWKAWCDYVVPLTSFDSFRDELRLIIRREGIGPYIDGLYVLGVRRPPSEFRFPLAPDSFATTQDLAMGVGVHAMVPIGDTVGLKNCLRGLRHGALLAVRFGGRPYLHGSHGLRDFELQRVFGDDTWRHWHSALARFDPAGRLRKR